MNEKQQQKSSQSFPINKIKMFYVYLMQRNYKMAYNGNIGLFLVTLLFIIREFQIISLISLRKDQNFLDQIPNLKQIFQIMNVFAGQFDDSAYQKGIFTNQQLSALKLWINMGILCLQVLSSITCLLPCSSSQINKFFSKFITIMSIILPIPTTCYFSKALLAYIEKAEGINENIGQLCISTSSFLMMLINHFIYTNFHYAFSIRHMNRNKLARFPSTWVKQFGWILFAFLHPFSSKYSYPSLFIVYSWLYLIFGCYEGKKYAIGFEYFDAKLCRNIGILCLFNITIAIAILSCFFGISLFINGLTSFIIAFYLFFVHFFLTFRKFWIKRIIIDDNTTTQVSQITYVTTFIVFLCDISQKKNQTYISSLLKNHCNNCNEVVCCCKNRSTIYDPSKGMFGNPQTQPHLDRVFIKHFYLKMIQDSIIQFQKSIDLKMLLCLFYLQFLELSPLCIKQIQYFNKKSIRDKLSLQQKFTLFCLQEEFKSFLKHDNFNKGDKKIQNVKIFDNCFNILIGKIIKIASNLKLFWEVNNTEQQDEADQNQKGIDQNFLSTISIKTIQIMEQIQSLYKQMKNINPNSFKFKEIMFFYSKEVINDMDLFIRIKQDLKIQKISHRNKEQKDNSNKKFLNIYNQNTVNFVIKDINTIKWSSNNAKEVFGFRKYSHLFKSNITCLMPIYFGKEHDLNVKNWLQTGNCSKMNKTTTIWCKKQNGSCFKALIYIKVVPNFLSSSQKFIEYYTTVEKIGSNQVICGPDGQIYGCDQNFKSIIKCSMKFIQNYRPNIQIFFPLLSQYFINYFYQQRIQNKRKYEDTFSGYIPNKITQLIQNITKEKQVLLQKIKKTKNYGQSYGLFIETKMQQITIYIKGSYITIDVQVYKQKMLSRDLIVIRIIKIQKNTIQKYFNQFQKTIKMIKLIKDQKLVSSQLSYITNRNSNKNNNIASQKNPLDLLINPKRLRKLNLLSNHIKDNNHNKDIKDQLTNQQIKNFKNQENTQSNQIQRVTIRKKRAINQRQYIKNERARKTIQRVKKVLYENKIFSANTLKMLSQYKQDQRKDTKDSNIFVIQEEYSSQSEESQQKYEKTMDAKKSIKKLLKKNKYKGFNNLNDEENEHLLNSNSSSEENNYRVGNRDQGNNKYKETETNNLTKQDQGVSFEQSTASSAAFISLSTKIKLLKTKLKEVKAKPILIVCCIIFIVLVVIGNILNIINTIQHKSNIATKNMGQSSKFSSYRLLQSTMLSKILGINRDNVKEIKNSRFEYYQNQLQDINKKITINQLIKYTHKGNKLTSNRQKIQVNLMELLINDSHNNEQISAYNFLLRQHAQLIHSTPTKSFTQYASIIRQLISSNIRTHEKQIKVPNIVYTVPFFILINIYILVNLYIAVRKVKCITKLISDLYQHQKKKYLRYYTKISNKITTILQVSKITQLQLSMSKSKVHNKVSNSSQMKIQNRQNISNSTYLLIKIIVIFAMIYVSVFLTYFYTHKVELFVKQQQYKFDSIAIGQLSLSYRVLIFINYHCFREDHSQRQINSLITSYNQFQQYINIVPRLIGIYNQPTTSQNIKNSIQNLNMNNLCYQLSPSYLSLLFSQSQILINSFPSKLAQQCEQIAQNLFISGTIKSIPYIYEYLSYYTPPEPLPNSSISLTLSHTQAITFIILHQTLFRQFLKQKQQQNKNIYYTWLIITGALIILSLILMIVWGYVFRKISYVYSGFNCYLIMLPFEVMIENPYIRHYLKEQLGFKSNLN